MHRILIVAVFGFTCLLSPTASIAVDMSQGRTDVQSFAGSFTHSIPIAVAPGRAGMQPALLLNYSSSMGNGLYGMGWSLDITRIERESKHGTPSYTGADTFVLVMKGARQALVHVGGNEYRVANESSFLKITKADGSWTIKDKNSTTYMLAAPWPVAGVSTFSWSLSGVTDMHGNSMAYRYSDGDNGHRLEQITYGPDNRVDFFYDFIRQDRIVSYRSGLRSQINARLTGIKSFAGTKLASHVSFDYSSLSGQNDYRSLLVSSTVHDVDGLLPSRSVSFGYSRQDRASPSGQWTAVPHSRVTHDSRYNGNYTDTYYFDPNGDGVTDTLISSHRRHRARIGGRTSARFGMRVSETVTYPDAFTPSYMGMATPETHKRVGRTGVAITPPTYYPHAIVDLHGDGYPDWVIKDDTGSWRVYSNSGRGLSTTYKVWADPAGTAGYRAFYDVNGDGLPDLLSSTVAPAFADLYNPRQYSAMNWSVYLNMSTYFNTTPFTHYLAVSPTSHAGILTSATPNILQSAEWSSTPLMATVTDQATGMVKSVGYVLQGGVSGAPEMKLWTVSKVTTRGPDVETRSVSFSYSGGLFVESRREFRGFATATQTDEQTGMTTITTYAQDIIFQGRIKTVTISLNDAELSSTVNAWAARDMNDDGKRHFAYLSSSTTKQYDLNGAFISSSNTTGNAYDLFGNLLESTTVTTGEFSKTISNTYSGSDTCAPIVTEVARQRWVKNGIPAYLLNSAYYQRQLGIANETIKPSGRGGKKAKIKRAKKYINAIHGRDWGGHWEAYTETVSVADKGCWKIRKLTSATVTSSSPTDRQTRKSSFDYYPNGFLQSETIEPDDATLSQITTYAYDSFGNRISTTVSGAGIQARTTSVTYDANGHFPQTTTNAVGHSESYTWDARFGAKKSLTGPNQLTTSWVYDGFGRKIKESRADGTFTAIDLSNAPASVTTTASGSNPSTIRYDARGREIQSEGTGFDGGSIYVDTEYDSLGRVYRKSLPHTGNATAWTSYSYDDLGRVLTATAPNGDISTSSYNGLTTTFTNALGQSKTSVKNTQGKVVTVTDHLGGTMRYAYDAFGNLTSTTDAANNVTTMSYDIRGRKIGMHDPDMGIWSYSYDVLGNLISQTDAKQQTTSMTYDALSRMQTRTELEGTSSWVYDSQWIGALSSESAPNGISKGYVYDGYGRVTASTTTINNTTYTVSNSYDSIGRVDTITYPTGLQVSRNYNQSGFLASVTGNNQTYWTANAMDEFGHITNESFGNGATTTHTYDNIRGVLTGINSSVNGSSIQNWNYDYDAVGNMNYRTDNTMGYTETFAYDGLNRLTSVTGPSNKTYAYDEIGNITHKSDVGAYTYDPNHPHAVATAGGNTYTYDANGNMTDKLFTHGSTYINNRTLTGTERTHSWTSFNKPLGIWTTNGYTGFEYDANHNRITKTTPAPGSFSETHYIGKIFQRTILNSVIKDVSHIYAGSTLIASIEDVAGIISTKYMHADHLGSINVITDETGAVLERLSFDAFGKPRNANGTDMANIRSVNTSRGYTGHEMDASTGLINMNARLYDPILGRFISADTIVPSPGNMQDFNRYAYVNNNPLMYTDPTGHWSLSNLWKSVRQVVVAAVVIAAAAITYGAISGFVAGYVGAGMAGSVISGAVAGAAAGFVGGASMTAIYGGNSSQIWSSGISGARMGAIAGGVAGGISWAGSQIGASTELSRIAGAGLGSAANGGNMERHVQSMMFVTAGMAMRHIYNGITGEDPSAGPGGGLLGEASQKAPGQDQWKDDLYNDFGFSGEAPPSPNELRFWFSADEGSLISRALNLVPGFNATAGFHDNLLNRYDIGNVSSMVPAAIISYGAFLPVVPSSVIDQVITGP